MSLNRYTAIVPHNKHKKEITEMFMLLFPLLGDLWQFFFPLFTSSASKIILIPQAIKCIISCWMQIVKLKWSKKIESLSISFHFNETENFAGFAILNKTGTHWKWNEIGTHWKWNEIESHWKWNNEKFIFNLSTPYG